MSLGKIARKLFGKNFYKIAHVYRSIFVDLNKVADSISPFIPQGASIVDLGGGDGEPLNYLLSHRHDITVSLIDPSICIGNLIKNEFMERVMLFPGMSITEFANKGEKNFDLVLISDVVHHIPVEERRNFFLELRNLIQIQKTEVCIIIKDIEPGYCRASLSWFADRYISGDKNVSLVG